MTNFRVERYSNRDLNVRFPTTRPSGSGELRNGSRHGRPRGANSVLKEAGILREHTEAWKVLLVDTEGGWWKRVEDEEKFGMWVVRVLYKNDLDKWKRYTTR